MPNVLDYGKRDPEPPHARIFFRVLAGLFASAGVTIACIVIYDAIQTSSLSPLKALPGGLLIAWPFGAVCLTGRMPFFKRWEDFTARHNRRR